MQVRRLLGTIILIAGTLLLIFSIGLSIIFGVSDISLGTVWNSIFHYDATNTSHQIIQRLRLPRTVAAVLIGAMLAASGAIMQGMTRNPLASPQIMGVTSGATFMIAIALVFLPGLSNVHLLFFAFAGAGLGLGLVFGVGLLARTGLTPVKLALAGTAITALLGSFSNALAIHFDVARDLSFWYAGGVANVQWDTVKLLFPAAVIGMILALFISGSVTTLSLGEDVATGLGLKTSAVKIAGVLVVLILTGAAVSVGGTIGFIGLVIPHITRFIVGPDYRWIIPCSAILGGILLNFADILSRMVNPPFETPVGALTALIGVPFFIYLARREGKNI
ncbi:iron complex transport system permease protein [Terribacillus aidingensis]|uniref:Iron complex transport system permease protein n=1 Tax=Terribacillus aidingensis TaxID=586416 RepID=A0A285N3P1_9BACI|nr:iron ABC transporter permease [Terribacillus aidingensis]SNZ02606.1 iron complex transport system permease protein [Terribacillus aidingensis]